MKCYILEGGKQNWIIGWQLGGAHDKEIEQNRT